MQAAGAGAVTINAGANAITLTNANNFTGAVSLTNTGANNVAVTDLNALAYRRFEPGHGNADGERGRRDHVNTDGRDHPGGERRGGELQRRGGRDHAHQHGNEHFTGPVWLTNSGAGNVSLRDADALALGR